MGVELTVKQESFCHAYIEHGGNASAAYREAFGAEDWAPESVHVAASRTLALANVALRVKELRAAIAEAKKLTVHDLINELEQARTAALSAETVQASAATAATMGKAKLLGMDKSSLEVSVASLPIGRVTIEVLSADAKHPGDRTAG